MLSFIQTGLCFFAICLFCVFIIKTLNMPSGLAPLAVLSCTLLYFTLAGCLGALTVSVWVYLALALGCGLFALIYRRKSSNKVLTPAFVLFVACSVGLLCLLAARQPLLNEWDDFSLWGTATKITAETNILYPTAPSGFPWLVSQKPGLIVMAYFFNFFGEFAPWRMFFSYDIIMLAAFAAVCSCVPFKKWQIAVPLYAVCAAIPFINIYTRMIYFTTPYLTGYADIPMGILIGGAFAFYYSASESSNKHTLLWVCAIIGAITLCKDTGMPLALLCAGVIIVDLFINHKNTELVLFKRIKGVWAKMLISITMVAAVGVCYVGYSKYLSTPSALGGESNMEAAELVINGLLMLLGLQPLASGVPFAQKFSLVFDNMLSAFFTSDITMLGTGLSVFGFVICILLIAYAITASRLHRRRIALFGTLGLLSFFPYYAFIGFTYVFIFKGNLGVNLVDYNRYVGCYYAALILGALVLLCISAVKEQRLVSFKMGAVMLVGGLALPVVDLIISTISLGRKIPTFTDLMLVLGLFCLVLFAAVFGHLKKAASFICVILAFETLLLFNQRMPRQLCIIDYPDAVYKEISILQDNADRMKKLMDKNSHVFFVSCKDDVGDRWFKYHYALYPAILDYSFGGGNLADAAALNSQGSIAIDMSIGQLAAYLYQSDNEYLYINSLNDTFISSYQALFKGEVTEGLYKIDKKANANLYQQAASGTQQSRLPNSIVNTDFVWCMDNPEGFLSLTLLSKEAK